MLSNDSNPAFCYPKKSWQNVAYDPEIGLIPKEENVEVTEINFFNQNSRAKYVRMMLVLNRIHQLLIDNEKITKRGLYYQLLVHQGGNMKQIDEAIHSIVVMLQIPRHQLHIMGNESKLYREFHPKNISLFSN